MQVATIPTKVITANRVVAEHLGTAHELTAAAQTKVEAGTIGAGVRTTLTSALAAAEQARDGAAKLGAKNILDGAFHRYATHSTRHLSDLVAMLERPGPLSKDATAIFTDRLFDAEVSTRLGTQAAARSLSNPIKRTDGSSSGSDAGWSGSPSSEPSWVDGQELDALGNPVRGGDTWAGPDGERYGSDGSAVDSGGSWSGPDDTGYSGI